MILIPNQSYFSISLCWHIPREEASLHCQSLTLGSESVSLCPHNFKKHLFFHCLRESIDHEVVLLHVFISYLVKYPLPELIRFPTWVAMTINAAQKGASFVILKIQSRTWSHLTKVLILFWNTGPRSLAYGYSRETEATSFWKAYNSMLGVYQTLSEQIYIKLY